MSNITVCKAGTPEWLEARKSGIGASEMAGLLGLGAKWAADELTLYARKVGAVAENGDQTERMAIGLALEPVILALYTERSKRFAAPAQELLRSEEHPWALATLDAWTRPDDGDAHYPGSFPSDYWPLELKSTSAYRDEDWAEGAPPHVLVQVHQQMLVTNAAQATVACLIGGQKLAWVDVPRDERLVDEIVRAGRLFWRRVEEKDPPKPTHRSSDVLRALFPEALPGKTVALGQDAQEFGIEWHKWSEVRKKAEEELEGIRNLVRATMGDAEEARLPDGSRFTWKTVRKAEFVMKAQQYRQLLYHEAK